MTFMKVPTYGDIADAKLARLQEAELAFWRNTAEKLRDDMEYLFEGAQRDKEVELILGSKKIMLVLVVKEEDK
jgi:hypothetical protein